MGDSSQVTSGYNLLSSPFTDKIKKMTTRPGVVVATTTFADQTHANEMAQRLLREGVAACVQVEGPLQSHYRWEGRLCQDTEWRLTIKTAASSLERLKTIVHRTHPYELPQWVVVEAMQVSDGYRDWVLRSITPTSDGITEA
jgi:periplasmic divalent cation tolerance protein